MVLDMIDAQVGDDVLADPPLPQGVHPTSLR